MAREVVAVQSYQAVLIQVRPVHRTVAMEVMARQPQEGSAGMEQGEAVVEPQADLEECLEAAVAVLPIKAVMLVPLPAEVEARRVALAAMEVGGAAELLSSVETEVLVEEVELVFQVSAGIRRLVVDPAALESAHWAAEALVLVEVSICVPAGFSR